MKEFEFTKGEWYLEDDNEYELHKIKCKRNNNKGIKMICDFYYDDESIWNSKLIASAPDLLYALINLVEIVENLPENKSILTALDNAKRAIDKATK